MLLLWVLLLWVWFAWGVGSAQHGTARHSTCLAIAVVSGTACDAATCSSLLSYACRYSCWRLLFSNRCNFYFFAGRSFLSRCGNTPACYAHVPWALWLQAVGCKKDEGGLCSARVCRLKHTCKHNNFNFEARLRLGHDRAWHEGC